KPVPRPRLREAVQKLMRNVEVEQKLDHYQHLLATNAEIGLEKLILPELGDKRIIELKDITAFEADGSYATIHLQDGRTIKVSKNLKYFEDLLAGKSQFFRSHRKWLIHLNDIESFNKSELHIHHRSGLVSTLSRRRIAAFTNVFES
ncbi:MAG: LytTR family DNA-binding domain-containing protein, partial [Bacteroidota bacterium]